LGIIRIESKEKKRKEKKRKESKKKKEKKRKEKNQKDGTYRKYAKKRGPNGCEGDKYNSSVIVSKLG
jgi:hypothetical protein